MTVAEPIPASSEHHGIDDAVYRRRWWTLVVLCLSLLIVFVGNSSLNVAIPTLSRELGATESQLQWVIAIYSLVFAGLLFTTGALGDRFGRKGALQIGLLIFLGACLLATLSDDMGQIIASRAGMGLGAALIMPSTLSILVNVFPPHERTKAIAIWASVTGAAGAIGPVASGFMLEHYWYGAVFLINVPFVLTALIAGVFLVPRSRDPEHGVLDPGGAVLSIIGLTSLVYGLIEAPERGWVDPVTLAAFAVAAVAIAAFVWWELRVEVPMLDMHFFQNRAFASGTAGMMLVFLAMFGSMFLMTQYIQIILGYSPLATALRLLPMAPIMIVVAPLTPRLSARFGANRTVAAGMVLIASGFMILRTLTLDSSVVVVMVALVPMTCGMALAMSPMTAAIMSAVPSRRAGAGSAMNDATRELGAALGIAVMGSIAASQYSSAVDGLTTGLPESARTMADASISGALQVASTLPGAAGDALRVGAETAFVDGIHFAVVAGTIIALFASVLVYRFMPRHLAHEGAMHGAVESMEDAAELGLAGVPPVFPDEVFPGDEDRRDADRRDTDRRDTDRRDTDRRVAEGSESGEPLPH
jgi:EmrB/QacA subfamily drug resistance transporter